MKKRGFTLIELLAVIVVLAIIAVIATPLVLNTIEDAKKGSAKSSGYTYISEVETSLAKYMLKNVETGYAAGKYDVATLSSDLSISIKGATPTEGNICIGSNGTVTSASLKINGYVISYDGKETTTTDLEDIEDVICTHSILDKAKTLVYDDTGVCKTDGTYTYMGGCYIKGTSSNNYVWYNGFMWRIMGINSDNTVRLITDENVTALDYGASGMELTYATNEGYIHDWLNDYFYSHLNSTKNIIQEGTYFCSELTTNSRSDRTECTSGSEVTAKLGIISLDEYVLANYGYSYLNNKQNFWIMTPMSSSYVWHAVPNSNQYLSHSYVNSSYYGIRPIINVKSAAIITGGDGTTSNYYVLGEDKSTDATGKLSEKVTSGEYVSLEGKTYRVVSKENDGVKLILDGYYEETEGTVYTMEYNETTGDNTFALDSGIGAKLNGDVLEWLNLSTSDKIVKTIYYQGDGIKYGTAYTEPLKQSNGIEAKVGLIQVGDLLAGQSSTMLTNNYTATSSYNNTSSYWTMNKADSVNWGWIVRSDAMAYSNPVANLNALRPVIVVRNDLEITSGNGTWNNPYEI